MINMNNIGKTQSDNRRVVGRGHLSFYLPPYTYHLLTYAHTNLSANLPTYEPTHLLAYCQPIILTYSPTSLLPTYHSNLLTD